MQSQKKSAFTLYPPDTSSIRHSHRILDCMFQSHAQVDDDPTLHISLHMSSPDLCSCCRPLALFISTAGKKYHVQQKLNRREGLLLRKLSYEIGLGLEIGSTSQQHYH